MRTNFFKAQWPAPACISAGTSFRTGGFSLPPFDSMNLGLHVGDCPETVNKNRLQIIKDLDLPTQPLWLNQTHSSDCVIAQKGCSIDADAAISRDKNYPLVILTADCLPVLFCNKKGTEIAALHAGWRGLVNGIIENTIKKMDSDPSELMAWIGPAICADCYETGEEVYQTFSQNYPSSRPFFKAKHQKWMADLASIAENILINTGVSQVFKSNKCTFELKNSFYSYRKSSETGRIGSFIWINQ